MDDRQQIEFLKSQLSISQQENRILKEILDEAGIPYQERLSQSNPDVPTDCDPDQGARIKPLQINQDTIDDFFRMFEGRKNVYDLRYTNVRTEKVGYYTQCFNFWKKGCHKLKKDGVRCRACEYQAYKPLQKGVIREHLIGRSPVGNDVLAIYPILENNTCHFLVFDFDNHTNGAEQTDFANENEDWKEEVDAMRQILAVLHVDALVERSRSGRGAHIWLFFKGPVPAKTARQFGFSLLEKGAESVNLKSFRYYDRMIPSQDVLPQGGLGNVIALPLQGQALKSGNSAFIDKNWNAYPDQLAALRNVKLLSLDFIEKCIKTWLEADPFKEADTDSEKRVKPWESHNKFMSVDVNGKVAVTLSNMVYIDTVNLKPRIQNQIRHLAAFTNPVFFKNQSMGYSNFEESRYIYLGQDENGYIGIPRGLNETLTKKLNGAGIAFTVNDQRAVGHQIHVDFQGALKESQIPAVTEMMKYDTGILHAATAFGKTVVCCNIIARRKINTLILLESSELVKQWQKAIEEFLIINEEPPEYKTPSGQIRKRKSVVGLLQGAHDSLTGIIDIAMVGSVCKKGELHPLLKQYGQVILDECHHAASATITEILQEVKAKYVFGVTATPARSDGKEKINYFLLGPVRFRYTAKDRAREQGIRHLVYPRFTRTVAPHYMNGKMSSNEAYEILRNNPVRDEQILADVKNCIENGRTPVVLTRYTEHAERLYKAAASYADKSFLMLGTNGKKKQHQIREELEHTAPEESILLVATGSLVGEGFDFPRLDTLIMATPVSGKTVVEQYVGRLNRDYDRKQNVIVYDYVDSHIPMFDQMYAKRLRAYKQIAYDICNGLEGEKQSANAIFDIDSYGEVYWRDLEEARTDVIISSPRLNTCKVTRLIETLQSRQENGLKVTIVTWHPDYYMYGKSETRMGLMEQLRKAGFHIELVEQTCEHFAVIDNEIVWYGSVNLLSKEDAEDNLMRVVNKEIAAELLELTFGSNISMEKW